MDDRREMIRIELGDWLYNAGIVGFLNILEHSKDNNKVEININEFSFDSCVLNNFENKFFEYMIESYKHSLSWHRVIEYQGEIDFHSNTDFQNFNEESLKKLDKYIEFLKRTLKSNSHKAAYELIDEKYPVLEIEKERSFFS